MILMRMCTSTRHIWWQQQGFRITGGFPTSIFKEKSLLFHTGWGRSMPNGILLLLNFTKEHYIFTLCHCFMKTCINLFSCGISIPYIYLVCHTRYLICPYQTSSMLASLVLTYRTSGINMFIIPYVRLVQTQHMDMWYWPIPLST